MTKTKALLAAIAAGTHRIDQYGFVYRWSPGVNEWVTDNKWRKDVVLRVQVELNAAPLRERLCAPMTVGQASIELSKVL